MPFIILSLVVIACAIGGGMAGWWLAVRIGRRVSLWLGVAAVLLAGGLLVAGGILPGTQGVAHTLPAVLLVLPAALGMLVGRLLAGWLRG